MKRFLNLFTLLVLSQTVVSQSWTFSFFERPYEEVVDSVPILDGKVWGDTEIEIPIGFDWMVGGKAVDRLFFEDGDPSFVSNTTFSSSGFSNLTYLAPALYLYEDRAAVEGATDTVSKSPISYKLEGEVGSRIFKLQFKDLAFSDEIFEAVTPLSSCSYQIWIYESDNSLEYHYGPRSIFHPEIAYGSRFDVPGIVAFAPAVDEEESVLLEEAYAVHGDMSNPSLTILLDYDQEAPTIDSLPAEDMVYRFGPGPVSVATTTPDDRFFIMVYPSIAESTVTIERGQSVAIGALHAVDARGVCYNLLLDDNDTADVSHLPAGMYHIIAVDKQGAVASSAFVKM